MKVKPKRVFSRKFRYFLLKIISFFSVVRGYNIWVIVLAQYLSSVFIFAPQKKTIDVLFDWRLFIIVLASSLAIASGYIINNFYDAKKDLINRPKKVMIDRLISQSTKLKVYFGINFLVVFLVSFVSWKAVLFFSLYIFLLWLYSHKLSKIVIAGNITASVLAILPFFGILMYFKNFTSDVFVHAFFLMVLLFAKEIVKDLENIKGDITNNYQTLPILIGEKKTKIILSFFILLTLLPIYLFTNFYDVGYMSLYFYFSCVLLFVFGIKIWQSQTKKDYLQLHLLLKIIILLGIFSIILINPKILLHGKKLLSQY